MTEPGAAPPRVVLARLVTEPPAPWHDMSGGLRDRYAADVDTIGGGQLASPATALSAITRNLARPGGVLLLVVSGMIVRFARRDGDVWGFALPNSIPGRPRSTLRLTSILEGAVRSAAERPLLVGLDATIVSDAVEADRMSATGLVEWLAVAQRMRFPSLSSIVVRASSIEHRASSIEHRASSIEHALDRILAERAADGRAADSHAVAGDTAALLRELGNDAYALQLGKACLIEPVPRRATLPEHVRADLFLADAGSRLDAALELAGLADDGNELARYELNDLAQRDPSERVREYAELLSRRSTQPTLAALRWGGRVPRHAFDAARHVPSLPEFVRQPGGTVPVGTDAGEPDEAPRHSVDIAPFRLARTPVTDRQYLSFLIAAGGPCPDHWAVEIDLWEPHIDRPVVMVSFHDARRYCEWLDGLLHEQGVLGDTERVVLPSEVEWECAASNGRSDRHPWGDQPDPTRCNIRATGLGRPTSVGAFSPGGDNATGCVDLVGNVWEWTRSAWGAAYRTATHRYPYMAGDGREDPGAPGIRRVVRGGAFYYATECADSHTRNRVVAEERHPGGGFRVAVTTVAPR